MRQRLVLISVLSAFLLLSTARADNSQITSWVQRVLITTLSVSYSDNFRAAPPIRTNYTDNAWAAITGFLGHYVDTVRAQQLTLHPVANGAAIVVDSGVFPNDILPGLKFWQVNQQITIPELRLNISFSVVVTLNVTDNKYRIQSLSMAIQ